MTQFTDLGLAQPILKSLAAEGYDTPTPIQAKAIPVMLEGGDVLGIAQTGTGKTAAFVLPLLHRLVENPRRLPPKTCRALIMAPTRELAAQIADSVRSYGANMRHSLTVVVGGAKPGPQIKALARGVDIVVATPGRLLDHITTNALSLNEVEAVVLDEADQMLDLGFMPTIRRILAKCPKNRQTMLLSATMPKTIRSLANDFLRNPTEISVTPVSKPVERIEQSVIMLDKSAKRRALAHILKDMPDLDRAIIFTRTKHGADSVARHLAKAGLDASVIHGNKSQNQRIRALAAFKSGEVKLMVATDIAARGIDVDGVSHVFNFELPNVPEAYVHRIGRTARAGRSGIAISFCDNTERPFLRDIERLTRNTLTRTPANPEWLTGEPDAPDERERGGRGRPQSPRNAQRPRRDAPASRQPSKGPRRPRPEGATDERRAQEGGARRTERADTADSGGPVFPGQKKFKNRSGNSKSGDARPNRPQGKRPARSGANQGGPRKPAPAR